MSDYTNDPGFDGFGLGLVTDDHQINGWLRCRADQVLFLFFLVVLILSFIRLPL